MSPIRLAMDGRAWRNAGGCRHGALGWIELKLRNTHGRNGPQIVRVQRVQKGLRDLGEFIVQLVMYPASQQRESLDQPLHMRVFTLLVRLQQQTARNLRIFLGELTRHLTDEI